MSLPSYARVSRGFGKKICHAGRRRCEPNLSRLEHKILVVMSEPRKVRLPFPWVFEKIPITLLLYPLHFCSLSLVFRQKSRPLRRLSHGFSDWLGDDASSVVDITSCGCKHDARMRRPPGIPVTDIFSKTLWRAHISYARG